MTLAEPTKSHQSRPEERDAAYRELWKSDLGDATEKVRVYLDGTQEIEGHPEIVSSEVLKYLRSNELHFVRLMRGQAN